MLPRTAVAVITWIIPLAALAGEQARLLPPDAGQGNAFYYGNRAPLLPSPLVKLPVGAVEPRGWLRTQLELQAEGFHGRLTEISEFLVKENNAWLSKTGQGQHGWEEVPYWLKGFANTGYLLQDKRIIDEAMIWIEAILASRKDDGWFGPDQGRTGAASRNVGRDDLWPNMIALYCLQSYYDHSGDRRVLDLMTGYFRWELAVPEDKFLPPYWQQQRAADNLHSVHWLYNRTGQPWLLELAEKIHRHTANWTDSVPNWHNVNIAQAFGGPARFYPQSKDPKHLLAAERNYQEVRSLYGQAPGGMFGGDENCRPGYAGPRQAIETCGIVEQMLSDETLLAITGRMIWADRCELVALNTLPAAFTADLKALHYLTAPNLVLCDAASKSPGVQNSGPMFLFDPHRHRCCQHNSGHGWPYYTEHLWMATRENGLAAVIFAPSRVTAKVGDGAEVSIDEETNYPFDESVRFTLATPRPVRFGLKLRVPGWCDSPQVSLNGKTLDGAAVADGAITIDRTWNDGDRVELELPMKIRLTVWEKNQRCVSVDRGPLTYSLAIGEKLVRHGGTDKWPAWEIHPTTPWNYGLVLEGDDPAAALEVVRKPMPQGQPFEATAAPIELKAKARKIPNWTLDHLGLVGPLAPSPVRSGEPLETVTLIPMGCARLRISAFPVIGAGPDAADWPKAPELAYRAEASHCCESDSVMAAVDGLEPRSSIDRSIPRMTWWPHTGTEEWLAVRLDEARKVSGLEVYWFDDTGIGRCRVPESWGIDCLDGSEWKPVATEGEPAVARDRYNRVQFAPVTTGAVRIRVKLQPEFSGGVLEIKIK
ncbi:MAG: beta-L-arabinofuranosidase domain-containing protein [Thermoguttaceae bacterium]